VFVLLADAEAKFATQGLRKDKRVIAYCGGGISATIDLFLLHRSATTISPSMTARWRMGQGRGAADRDGLGCRHTHTRCHRPA
jgi:hypothetical protein